MRPCYFRYGYDIALPLQARVLFHSLRQVPSHHRKYLATFKVWGQRPGGKEVMRDASSVRVVIYLIASCLASIAIKGSQETCRSISESGDDPVLRSVS